MTVASGTTSPSAEGARDITLHDVAQEAGVSIATASKALNDRFDVSKTTRDRVVEVADRLGFVPNALARGLLAGKTHTVGILTNDMQGRFVSRIMQGAENEIGRESSTVLLANSDGNFDRQTSQLQALLERRVDGLIIVDERMEERPPLLLRGPTPIVYAFGMSSNPEDTSLVPDVRGGGQDAARHLLSLGRRDLVHIGGEETSYSANARAQGFSDVAPKMRRHWIFRGDYSEQCGWDATSRLLEAGHRFDGIVAGNDQIARGAIDRIQSEGLQVPDDVAVIGYDDWQVLSLLGRVPITTIDMRLEELGAEAVRQLYGKKRTRGRVLIPWALIPRYSTLGPDAIDESVNKNRPAITLVTP